MKTTTVCSLGPSSKLNRIKREQRAANATHKMGRGAIHHVHVDAAVNRLFISTTLKADQGRMCSVPRQTINKPQCSVRADGEDLYPKEHRAKYKTCN